VSGVVYVDDTDRPRQLTISAAAGGQGGHVVHHAEAAEEVAHIRRTERAHGHRHTDVQANVIKVHNRNTDLALELVRECPLSHWNLESSWAAQVWLEEVSPARQRGAVQGGGRARIGLEAST